MATRKKTKKGAGKANSVSAMPQGAQVPMADGMQQGMPYNPITKVEGYDQYHKEVERLRSDGYFEVRGALGGGSSGGLGVDWGDFVASRMECSADCGTHGKGNLPIIHVSGCNAVPVTAQNGHKGEYISWGFGNKVPNVMGFLSSILPYTAAGHRFNKNLLAGLGVKPVYRYVQYVGGNITEKTIEFAHAGVLLMGLIRDLQRDLVKLESEHPELTDDDGTDGVLVQTTPPIGTPPDSGGENNTPAAAGRRKSAAEQMRDDINDQIDELRKQYLEWERTRTELDDFLRRNNISKTFLSHADDMDLFELAYAEFELQKDYLVETGRTTPSGRPEKRSVSTRLWTPKITGVRYRDCHTVRPEKMDSQNRINYVYISNQWLDQPSTTVDKLTVDAMPAISLQSPTADMERAVAQARTSNVAKNDRPTRFALPLNYGLSGHPYFPIPAWWSIVSGDVYTYASLLISDRKKRRDNANVIGRILYVSDEYVQRMYIQRHLDTPEQRREFFQKEIVEPINKFLKNRDNMGEPMLAYTFKDSDGKTYKSWEIVEVEENSKNTAEANKEELAEVSSIILFAKGLDSQLIGNTPGTTTRSGGTDLRERYLLKEIQASPFVQLLLTPYRVVRDFNGWDSHLDFEVRRMTMTTLDRSSSGLTESEVQ